MLKFVLRLDHNSHNNHKITSGWTLAPFAAAAQGGNFKLLMRLPLPVHRLHQGNSDNTHRSAAIVPAQDWLISNVSIIKPPLRSSVWKHFGFCKDGDVLNKSLTVCRICTGQVNYNGNTTNRSNHLLRRHWIISHKTDHPGTSCSRRVWGWTVLPGC